MSRELNTEQIGVLSLFLLFVCPIALVLFLSVRNIESKGDGDLRLNTVKQVGRLENIREGCGKMMRRGPMRPSDSFGRSVRMGGF